MPREVYANAGGVTDIISMEVTADAGAACARFSFQTPSSSFEVGQALSLQMGYTDGSATVLTGYVDSVTAERPPGLYRIEGRDKLKLALDYFIVAASLDKADFFNPCPGTPGNYTPISPGEIITDILALCGLGGVSGGAGWEIGTVEDGTPFQLISAWDAIQQVCGIGAWRVWCDAAGTIRFGSITESYGGGQSFTTGNDGNIVSCSYSRSDEDLRNKVVVIGYNGDYIGTASAASPYCPIYKTAVISTDLVGSDAQAAASASANLTALNKLTERTTIEAVGTPGVERYGAVTVSESFTGAPGGMVTSVTHAIDSNGYRTQLTATVV